MRKTSVRIIAIVIVAVMVLGLFSSALVMLVSAATPVSDVYMTITPEGIGGNKYTIEFTFTDTGVTGTAAGSETITPVSSTNIDVDTATKTITQSTTNYTIFKVKLEGVVIPQVKSSMDLEYSAEYTVGGAARQVSGRALYRTSTPSGDKIIKVITADTTVSKTLTFGKISSGVTVKFAFLDTVDYDLGVGEFSFDRLEMPTDSSFGWGQSSKLKVESKVRRVSGEDVYYYQATLSGVSYTGGSSRLLELTVDGDTTFNVTIPSKYFSESGGEDTIASDIVVQSVHVYDAAGVQLASVTKDSKPFRVDVIFYDMGLKSLSKSELEKATKRVFITNAPGFKTLSGTSGTLELMSTSGEYPRFRAIFKNMTTDGTGTAISFRTQYDVDDNGTESKKSVKGEASVNLFQVTKPEEESKADETAPLKPNVIIQEYNYSKEQIVAGDEFDLELRFRNTSRDTGVDNVVMTIEPNSGFVIASASNTTYFESMAPGEVKPFTITLRAAASAGNATGTPQTDYSVQVKFSYQYLSKKEFATGESAVKIAIPVVQLDRFSVDEITQYTQYLMVGEEGSVTVPVINKGKSLTYNISGEIKAANPESYISPIEHMGNLEAGKSGELSLSVTVNVPGEFNADAVISYEDENGNQKQLSVPFTIMVEQHQEMPEIMPPTDVGDMQPQGPGPLSIILCSVGAMMVASPIALYLIKRVKARGSEDIDEDF